MKGNGFKATTTSSQIHANTGTHTTVPGPPDQDIYLQKFTGFTPGTKITSVIVNVFAAGAGGFRAKVYNDTGSLVGPALLGQSNSIIPGGAGLLNLTLTSPAIVGPTGNVWAGFENDVTVGGSNLYYTFPMGGVQFGYASPPASHVYGPGPDPCPNCASTYGYAWYIGVNYLSAEGDMNFKLNTNSLTTSPASPIVTNSTGGFSAVTFAIPNTHNGTNTVNATDGTTTKSATLTVYQQLFLNSTNGNVGKTISLSGNGWDPFSSLTTRYSGTVQGTSPATPSTNSTGGFSALTFVIPESTAGPHAVNVTSGLALTNQTNYNVTSSLSISPTSGAVGTALLGTAKGFLASHNINIKFDGVSKQNGTSNTIGSFASISFNIPSALAGSHTVSATDGSHTATATFTIPSGSGSGSLTPAISLNVTSGATGSGVSVNGNGFNKTSHIQFYFNGGLLGTSPAFVQSNSTGSFANTIFTVPLLPLGAYVVKANDTLGNSATTTYTISSTSTTLPDAVTDLQFINVTKTSVQLSWTQPNLHGGTLTGYILNVTTPYGIPSFVITSNAGNPPHTVSSLTINTQYSFRIGVQTNQGLNPYGNILNVQTLTNAPANYSLGVVNINGTNPVHQPIRFTQTAGLNSSYTNINVFRPTAYNLTCNISYTFAATSKNYTNLSKNVFDSTTVYTTFQFKNSQNEIITIKCADPVTKNSASTVLTQTNFPLLQQVNNFRNGTYGTHGQLGALDLITVVAVIISMIGFNRVNEAAGVILSIIMVGVLAYFQIIQWPTVVLAGLAVVVMIAVASTRKTSGS